MQLRPSPKNKINKIKKPKAMQLKQSMIMAPLMCFE